MRIYLAGIWVVACVILAGCHSEHSIIGTWEVSGKTPRPEMKVTATFAEHGKMRMVVDAHTAVPSEADLKGAEEIERKIALDLAKLSFHTDSSGTFKLERDTLALHWDQSKTTFAGAPAKAKAAMERSFKKTDQRALESLNKSGAGKVTWIDNDHFSVKEPGADEAETYTRIK